MKQHLILKDEFWKKGRGKSVCGLTEGQDVYATTHYRTRLGEAITNI